MFLFFYLIIFANNKTFMMFLYKVISIDVSFIKILFLIKISILIYMIFIYSCLPKMFLNVKFSFDINF